MVPNISSTGRTVLAPNVAFNGVKIFSATMMADRAMLGTRMTEWIAGNPQKKVTEVVVTQSSDDAFHCITLTAYYFEKI
jgi:hypothetical protein